MLSTLGVIIVLGILITVHESGHFMAARLFGVYVEKFSIGFGPKIFSRKWGETEFRVSWIPLGGYVKMKGENPGDDSSGESDEFTVKSWWQKSIIALAGPLANLVFAVLLMIVSFMIGRAYEDNNPIIGAVDSVYAQAFQAGDIVTKVNGNEIRGWSEIAKYTDEAGTNRISLLRDGREEFIEIGNIEPISWYTDIKPHIDPVVGELILGLPAYKAGLMEGDRIVKIDTTLVRDWYHMNSLIQNHDDNEITLTIEREGKTITALVALDSTLAGYDKKMIGISQPSPVQWKEHYTPLEAIQYGTLSSSLLVVKVYEGLYQLLLHPSSLKTNIGSPVMMVPMSKQIAKRGLGDTFSFIAAISLLLMVMNLLPIPVLDGGQIFFFLIEAVFRKPLPLKVQMILQQIGFSLLLFLMIYALYNDFSKIFIRNMSMKHPTTVETTTEP